MSSSQSRARSYVHLALQQEEDGKASEALQTLRQAASLFPDDPLPIYQQAVVLFHLGYINKATEIFKNTIAKYPSFLLSYNQLGLLYEGKGLVDEALKIWKSALDLKNASLHSRVLAAYLKSPTITPEQLLETHLDWARRYAQPQAHLWPYDFPKYQQDRPLNVAYTCSYWHTDTIKFQLLPILRAHDRKRVKIFGYLNSDALESENADQIKNCTDVIRPFDTFSLNQYVDSVRKDQIDVLIELNGHTPGHHFRAMASRCAPVQVSYLNYTSTCGVPNVDYVIADDICVTEEEETYFTEKVYRIPGSFFCFNYDEDVFNNLMSVEPPSKKNGYVTFGCFGSGGKINPVMVDWWAQILKREPTAKLFIRNNELTPADNRRFMEESFAKHGIGKERLILQPGANREGVIQSYREVDISLDTFPYCGGNTIAESLWQGVPVVTYKGERFSAAYGASLMRASGCPELIATTVEEYVSKAVELAKNPQRLEHYRKNLRQMVYDHGFMNAKAFAAKLEDAYEDMRLQANESSSCEKSVNFLQQAANILSLPNEKCREFLSQQILKDDSEIAQKSLEDLLQVKEAAYAK